MLNDQLEALYIKYHRELYLYAFSLCKDYHLAQDLTSETFFKAILSLDDDVDYIKYWLFKVCKNLFIDGVRKDREYSNTEGLEDKLTSAVTPLDRLIESEDKKNLYNQVISLHHTYSEILILYYYCDFTLNEICKTTGMTAGAAKTLLFRARKRLKTKLEGKNEI